jgi:release factor glutamine methyltransferase
LIWERRERPYNRLVTVLEGIQRSTEFLARKGVDSARLQAELLLAHVLKLERMRLYLNFERSLSTEESDRYRDLVMRRGNREPLQQIVGSTSFCGIEIAVNRYVLVPRPETEMLAEMGWQFLKPKVESEMFDLGTGSGCLAIAIAKNCEGARVVAGDVSTEALKLAKMNAEANDVMGRIDLRIGNGFEVLNPGERFDLIVSNPPYISSSEIESLQPEVRDFEPRGALDGGMDGLDWYRRIAKEARTFLRSGGKAMLEFGDGQHDAIRKIFEEENWIVEAIVDDYTRRPRIVVAAIRD